jgi:peptide chain release factor 2
MESENDESLQSEIENELKLLKQKIEDLEIKELLSEENDTSNAIVSINAGAGGTEAQDWAEMLLRMYLRWCEKNRFKVEFIDKQTMEEAGIKSATFIVKGNYAYGLLKSETGIHRLVRISPFDANKKRHTSFASVSVIPELSKEVNIDINEGDLKIDTYRASGAGGQHVNKTDSAVRITHLPTGTVVQCQNERSQHRNKEVALSILKAKLYELERKAKEEELQNLKGEQKEIGWGSQIRSYIMHPYQMVKDHRTQYETGNINAMLDGELLNFFIKNNLILKKTKREIS